jgi:hypothetical protein
MTMSNDMSNHYWIMTMSKPSLANDNVRSLLPKDNVKIIIGQWQCQIIFGQWHVEWMIFQKILVLKNVVLISFRRNNCMFLAKTLHYYPSYTIELGYREGEKGRICQLTKTFVWWHNWAILEIIIFRKSVNCHEMCKIGDIGVCLCYNKVQA